MTKCQYYKGVLDRDYQCKHPVYKDKYCVFHHPDIKEKEENFLSDFCDWVIDSELDEFIIDFDFTGFVFPTVDFSDIVFTKRVNFSDAKFSGNAHFSFSKFLGDAHFSFSQFSGNTYFNKNQFSGNADFSYSQFTGNTYFNKSQFTGNTYFNKSQFSGNALFSESQFSGGTFFSNSQFSGDAVFYECQFSGAAIFQSSEFSGKANFSGSIFSIETDFKYCQALYGIYFIGTKFRKKVKKFLGIPMLYEETKVFEGMDTNIIQGNPIFKQYADDQAYIEQFKNEHKYLYWLWRVFTDCGRSLLILSLWSVLLSLVFAGIYTALGCEYFSINDDIVKGNGFNFWTMAYYSIVTYTTLGFGDVTPTQGLSMFFVSLEVISGYLSLGMLISVLANKVARRA